ncbi:MAG TPA: alpha/beta family hydrolase [bacterium]|nr:alpha/beta family hydrolase [bacterium]
MADQVIPPSVRDDPCQLQLEALAHPVSAVWTRARRPCADCVLAHGAGAGMTHPFLMGAAHEMAGAGISVLRFNFPYMESRRRLPGSAASLVEPWRAVLAHVAQDGNRPVVAAGKSMGGRVASMLAAQETDAFAAAGLVFFGYPLHPAGKPGQLRDAHLPHIRRPMLFIQGSRDALARIDLIEAVVDRLRPLARLHVVPGADHSFRAPREPRSQEDLGRAIGRIAGEFIRELVST